jgi:two-component system CheB/CheR fusion protein
MISHAIFSIDNRICELAMQRADAAPLFAHLEARLNSACNEFMVMMVDVTERQQAMTNLLAANAQLARLANERAVDLQSLSGELVRAEQRERDYFYELLHDHVQPLLVAARLGLSGLGSHTPPSEMLSVIAEANVQISRVIQTARTLSVELSPPLIREKGLIPALESLCRWVQSNYGLTVDMDYDPDAEPASMTIRLICFKAVRELLMNAVKYAGTQDATLDLEHESANVLCITIRDNGVGFDPSEIHGSGLANIERRLGMVGGRLSIQSGLNAGTIAKIWAPIEMRSAEKPMNNRGRRIGDPGPKVQNGFADKRFNL